MLVLIDESGDPGFKLSEGSSLYFVIGIVIFRDLKEAEKTSKAITNARQILRAYPEFRFSKTSNPVRDGFFEAVNPFDFGIRVMVVDKNIIHSNFLKSNTECFYNYFVQEFLKRCHFLDNASVKIDGSGDRKFKREFTRYLRQQIDLKKIKKVKFAKSHGDNLIQLADMVTGAISRPYHHPEKDNSERWKIMINSKIENIWEFK
jgi:hypothetical protein